MFKKKRYIIGGIIILLALGYLGYTGFRGSSAYYYTVGELMEQGSSAYDTNIRVSGEVAPGSVEQDAAGRTIRFTIVEGSWSLPVVYQGVLPDAFKVGSGVILEGYLTPDGVFQAGTLSAQCPSRYVADQ